MRAIMRCRGVAAIPLGRDGATSGLMRPQQRKAYSIPPIGPSDQARRNLNAKLFGRLKVDDQFPMGF